MNINNPIINKNDIMYGIATDNINLRPTMSTKEAPLCKIPHGTIFPLELSEGVENDSGTWYPVEYNGLKGYLSSVTFRADLSPACTGYVSPNSSVAQLIAAFNSEAASRRIFDEVHYYSTDPHLTLGFGHFAGGTQDDFIQSMLANEKMRQVLIDAVTTAFSNNSIFVSDARNEGYRMLSFNDGTVSGVEEFLSSINLETGAVNDRNKNKFPGGGKKNGYWLNDVLVDMLKDKNICAWQIKFWIEHTLADAKEMAAKIGLADHYGAVATLTSMRSSGLMDESTIKSLVQGVDKDTAAMKLWIHYNIAKKSKETRGRQKAIFSRWYSNSWKIIHNAICPKKLSDCSREGEPMERASNGVAFDANENKDDLFNIILQSHSSC